MKLIVGLGNPGRLYKNTRHNIGFMFVDELAKSLKQKFIFDRKLKSEVLTFNYREEKIIIIKPQTYMNLSGEAVQAACQYYKVTPDDVLIIYDDLDLPTGKIRIRSSGSSGGHKGMTSIIEHLKTEEIKRIRIGIGKDKKIETCDYVLGKISTEEEEIIDNVLLKAFSIFESYLTLSFDDFMGRFN